MGDESCVPVTRRFSCAASGGHVAVGLEVPRTPDCGDVYEARALTREEAKRYTDPSGVQKLRFQFSPIHLLIGEVVG